MVVRCAKHSLNLSKLFLLNCAALMGGWALVCVASQSVSAETLRQSLLSAYHKNPLLDAQRSRLRAEDESVPQALSSYRPSAAFSADASVQRQNNSPDSLSAAASEGISYPGGYSLSLSQKIFDGTRRHNLDRAEAVVLRERQSLRATEQTVLLNAVAAFMNVVRDAAIVRLRENNVKVLSRDLRATQDRFAVGEVTRTDVAQSRARRAQSVSDLELARANLKASRAGYEQVVGYSPRGLREPNAPSAFLPKTLAETRQRAEIEHPDVLTALYEERAAYNVVKQETGTLLPTLQLDATYSNRYSGGGDVTTSQSETGNIKGTLTVPLYQSGLASSRIRQSKHRHLQALKLVEQERNEAREGAIAAWAQLNASRAQLRSTITEVEANRIALSGVREEEKVGQRTLLDVLDAEQELLNSQVSLVSNRRDLIVNSYNVLAAIGRLTAKGLKLSLQVHDPKENYNNVRRKWYGISITDSKGNREYFQAEEKPSEN